MTLARGMQIERLVVEEGFLDGLDLTFDTGLNVVIGHRGVGKTSVIQLLRFCLGGRWAVERDREAGLAHARSVLGGDGRVSVAVRLGDERFVVSRRAGDATAEGQNPFVRPIVFAQGEIESVALDPRGRLRLLDDFVESGAVNGRQERELSARIASLTRELADLADEINTYSDRLAQLGALRSELAHAQEAASRAADPSNDLADEIRRLDRLAAEAARHRQQVEALAFDDARLSTWRQQIADARDVAPEPTAPEAAALPASQVSQWLWEAASSLDSAIDHVDSALEAIRAELERHREVDRVRSDKARRLRQEVEAAQTGMGVALRRVAQLQEQVAALESLTGRRAELEARAEHARDQRSVATAELDRFREQRFERRTTAAQALERSLAPTIEVSVERSGLHDQYASIVAGALRGSGLKYSQLSADIADRIAPSDLVRLIEMSDVDQLARRLEVPKDRALRMAEALRREGLEDIASAPIDDEVTLRLLDGTEHKPTTQLSTGQRCTVVLPILMLHDDRPLLLDQPEDNLDGAFIADTLVRAILRRVAGSQLIVTTHNANVPVLGAAHKVIQLGSDGRRGYVVRSGSLDKPEIVEAITSVMEGGREAFARRASFYESLL